MDTQELQDSEKVLDIWVEKLKNIVHKMNNTKSMMIDIKLKGVIKRDMVELDLKYIKRRTPYLKIVYTNSYNRLVSNMEIKKEEQLTLYRV